jgi:isopentenyl diphosphate isomerase/L-lactate dehydrogenase-like FMN-dependent dehydrogenase
VFLDGGVCLGTDVLNALALRASGLFVSVHMFVALISSFDPSLVVF